MCRQINLIAYMPGHNMRQTPYFGFQRTASVAPRQRNPPAFTILDFPRTHKKVEEQAQNREDSITLPAQPSPAGLQQFLALMGSCWGNLLRGHKCVGHKSMDSVCIRFMIP